MNGLLSRSGNCVICGAFMPIITRKTRVDKEGRPICVSCTQTNPLAWETCAICGERKSTNYRIEGKLVCHNCYDKKRHKWLVYPGTCAECGRAFIVYSFTHKNEKGEPVCHFCKKKVSCIRCGRRFRPSSKTHKTDSGNFICYPCHRRHKQRLVCGRLTCLHDVINCDACRLLVRIKPCQKCGEPRFIAAKGLCWSDYQDIRRKARKSPALATF